MAISKCLGPLDTLLSVCFYAMVEASCVTGLCITSLGKMGSGRLEDSLYPHGFCMPDPKLLVRYQCQSMIDMHSGRSKHVPWISLLKTPWSTPFRVHDLIFHAALWGRHKRSVQASTPRPLRAGRAARRARFNNNGCLPRLRKIVTTCMVHQLFIVGSEDRIRGRG